MEKGEFLGEAELDTLAAAGETDGFGGVPLQGVTLRVELQRPNHAVEAFRGVLGAFKVSISGDEGIHAKGESVRRTLPFEEKGAAHHFNAAGVGRPSVEVDALPKWLKIFAILVAEAGGTGAKGGNNCAVEDVRE
jgi:hypothetical protein